MCNSELHNCDEIDARRPPIVIVVLGRGVAPTAAEVTADLPGDAIVADADAVMDRAFTLDAPPEEVWPWLVQLGKGRAGWYASRRVESCMPRSRRAVRHIDPRWQDLAVGSVIPDYGGRDETFTVAEVEPPRTLVYTSQRGRIELSWAIVLAPTGSRATRVHLRLRLGPVKRKWLVGTVGELFDLVTISWLAGGLRERVRGPAPS